MYSRRHDRKSEVLTKNLYLRSENSAWPNVNVVSIPLILAVERVCHINYAILGLSINILASLNKLSLYQYVNKSYGYVTQKLLLFISILYLVLTDIIIILVLLILLFFYYYTIH